MDLPDRRPSTGVERYARAALAEKTIKGYREDWVTFTAWCQLVELEPLAATPADIARFVARLADDGAKAATIQRRLQGISKAFTLAGLDSPTKSPIVHQTMKGIRRTIGTRQTKKKALVIKDLLAFLDATGDNLLGIRDRAVLSLGFVGGLRRGELAALELKDLAFVDEGILLLIPRSKTDQEAQGRYVEIPATGSRRCPVKAVEAWIDAAEITEGRLFRELNRAGNALWPGPMSHAAVARMVKRLAKRAGLEGDYSGHSLRAGFATQGTISGIDATKIMQQTGWTSTDTMRGYIRDAELFRVNYSALMGL